MHEMVSDGSSLVENWTHLRNISMCVLLGSKNTKETQRMLAISKYNEMIVKNIYSLSCINIFDINEYK